MPLHTKIEWTDRTWNPVRGCSIVSPGCINCYAMKQAHRFSGKGRAYEGLTKLTSAGPQWTGKVRPVEDALLEPLKWRKPQRVFVNSMSDLFHEGVPDVFIDRVFAAIAFAGQHMFQVLTKRPGRMRDYMTARSKSAQPWKDAGRSLGLGLEFQGISLVPFPLPNVWLGTSCENQQAADERIPLLLQTPAAVRFVSAEPLIGPIDFAELPSRYDNGDGEGECNRPLLRLNALTGGHYFGRPFADPFGPATTSLDWVIVGGESGPGARPMHPEWARSLRDQCAAAGVPFFFKQWGEWSPFVERATGRAARACWFNGKWDVDSINLASDADWPDEDDLGPLLYRVGKHTAGHLLDGVAHREFPEARS